jgi:pantoate--beta-alanine ligase
VITIENIAELRVALADAKGQGAKIALVPTMGALHAGHMALVDYARTQAEFIIGTIFVNPRQFGPKEDFTSYPRALAADKAKLEVAGVDILWAPTPLTMYPQGYVTNVRVPGLSETLCGAARPGHFDGVATVVTKLFTIMRPDVAVFGEKDWQQLAIIRRLNEDLNLNVEIHGLPIVREADGLAMSSRNLYLNAQERAQAVALPQALARAQAQLRAGGDVADIRAQAMREIVQGGFAAVDYVELVDAATLAPLATITAPARLLAAAHMGSTRLIDNVAV